MDIKETRGMIEVVVGLEKGNMKVILEAMIEVAIVGLDHVQKQLLIEIE